MYLLFYEALTYGSFLPISLQIYMSSQMICRKRGAKSCTGIISGRKTNSVLDCFIESKADNTENCQGPPLGLIKHLLQSPNVRPELYCPALNGWNLLELTINNESQILFLHLDFQKYLSNLREACRNYALRPIRITLYRAHKRVTLY